MSVVSYELSIPNLVYGVLELKRNEWWLLLSKLNPHGSRELFTTSRMLSPMKLKFSKVRDISQLNECTKFLLILT